jgi:hypothetical protein
MKAKQVVNMPLNRFVFIQCQHLHNIRAFKRRAYLIFNILFHGVQAATVVGGIRPVQ